MILFPFNTYPGLLARTNVPKGRTWSEMGTTPSDHHSDSDQRVRETCVIQSERDTSNFLKGILLFNSLNKLKDEVTIIFVRK